MGNVLDNKPNELYVQFMRQYNNLHRCCPTCGAYNQYKLNLDDVGDEQHPEHTEEYKNKMKCTCLNCGWNGIYDERVPDRNIYPEPYYIHKKTGNRYCKVTDNFMFKENGEWKRGLVLYKTMYWNPDGEYFARTKEDFKNNFEQEIERKDNK